MNGLDKEVDVRFIGIIREYLDQKIINRAFKRKQFNKQTCCSNFNINLSLGNYF